jgi:acyl transferase domain-containing protein/NADPH:quinone reductase-like Zn-dependent oxidoreductase/NADP-dependent 3-hydroxy acid dehydrogenase YdfG/acyl carrier protein
LPGTDASSIWQDLCDGRDLVTQVDPLRWEKDSFLHPAKGHPGCSYTFASGSIGDVSGFDAGFFGISPREAACMDPQQRLLLELAWEAMAHAGTPPLRLRGSNCGVYIGISTPDYSFRFAEDLSAIESTTATGNSLCIAANRISYFFDLHGPSMVIDTACSSSLVAFHQACRAISGGEIDSALTGGVSLHLHPYGFLIFAQASMLSPRGRCSVFDESADGYVRSEGGGLFLLKEYEQAVADGDQILAVVAATAVNTDGRKSGLTVPSAAVQAELIGQACRLAGIEPTDIDYFEAHGTGTAVGDPIEARALGEALGMRRPKEMPLPVGSIKSNLGHLEAAAGVAGLVKSLLALQHRLVPATAGIKNLNPAIDFTGLNLEVVINNLPLKPEGTLRIGVNSFGFGGANAHVILESASVRQESAPPVMHCTELPLVISARDEVALKTVALDVARLLETATAPELYDVAHSLLFRRDLLPCRAVLLCSDRSVVAEELHAFAVGTLDGCSVESGLVQSHPSGPVFVYDGNGSQWEGMGIRLLDDPVFRKAVEALDTHFTQYADFSLVDELAGQNGSGRYEFTEIAQPALFAIQVGVTCVLRSLGVEPIAVVGHSVGEIAAAWACGALTLPDAVKVIYHRSRLQGLTKGLGRMTAVSIGSAQASELLAELPLPSLALAGCNSPGGVTIAGAESDLERFEALLAERLIVYKRLALDYAFHSIAMDSIEPELLRVLEEIVPGESATPFYSTVTGGLLAGDELVAGYWWKNIREPVLFEQAVGAIIDSGTNVFVCVTPHAILKNYVLTIMESKKTDGCVIPTLHRGDDAPHNIRKTAARTIIAGGAVNWSQLFPTPGCFVQLPNYPWQRERCWLPISSESSRLLERHKYHPLLGYRLHQHECTWENRLDTALYPVYSDHAVGGATVFPGTGYLEFVLAAALSLKPDAPVEVDQLEIRAPLLLDNGTTRLVRLAVTPGDGTVSIKGRDLHNDLPWTTHCVARIVPATCPEKWDAAPFVSPHRPPDFDRRSHGLLTAQAGLQYGPGFQAIQHGWVDGQVAVALLQTPEAVQAGLDDYHLHPTFLDNALQLVFQIVQSERSTHAGMTYIPTTIDHINFNPGMMPPRYATAKLTGHAPHSLTADFMLYDPDGLLIASVRQVHFRRIRLQKQGGDSLNYPEYHRIPKPLPNMVSGRDSVLLELVIAFAASAAEHASADQSVSAFAEELDPLLESLCSRIMIEALHQVAPEGQHVSDEALQQLYTKYPPFQSMIQMAIASGVVVRDESGVLISKDEPDTLCSQALWHGLVNLYPDRFALILLAGRFGLSLTRMLRELNVNEPDNQRHAVQLELLQQALGGGGRYIVGKHMQHLLADLQLKLPEGERLGIIEFGEGLPVWLEQICSSIDFERCDYHFASGSPSALDLAAQLRDQFSGINLFDLSQSQTPPTASAQLAVVTCDFRDQTSAEQSLCAAWNSLLPGGCIIMVGLHHLNWTGFLIPDQHIWQSLPAWWEGCLKQNGYSSFRQFDLSPRPGSGCWLLTAQKPASAEICIQQIDNLRTVLLVHDDHGPSADLAASVSAHMAADGKRCIRLNPRSEDAVRNTLLEAGELLGILFLAGLNSTCDLDSEAYLDRQVDRCSAASQLSCYLERLQVSAPVWLFTVGSAADVAGWPIDEQDESALADCSFWAFGRTLMNENSGLDLRLICLEGGLTDNAAALIKQELECSDAEQEVMYSAAGKRFVPRLVLESSPESAVNASSDSAHVTTRLAFQFPGQLRNLRWEDQPRVAPVEDQLEIEVHATGLNFRDIMYTLGLLSDEAVENGFAGASLGLECAGVVTGVGPLVTGFAPGDRVVAFGPASFATRALTRVSAAAHIPAGLDFESAATIPATFFTVWYALCHQGRLQPGEKVLIHGAAGGVGLAAIQVARRCGAEVYATAGTDEKRDFLRLMGVEHIYDSRTLDFADQILLQTGGAGVDLVLNSLAGEAINSNLRVLKPFGRFLELGKRDFYENTRIGLRPFRNNISYFGIDADQVMQLQPDLTRRLFGEIMELFELGIFRPLPYTAFEADQVVDAFRYMQQSRQIGKIVVTYRNEIRHRHPLPSNPQSLKLMPDATWLVTGGLGGFGLRTARWLVTKGCCNLALISRNGPIESEAQEAIKEFRQQGVTVYAAACDVTDRSAVARLLKTMDQEMPPLKGIVHAATVIEDGLLQSMQPDQIRRVLSPKILGALHLHHLTKEMQLEYFVLYSSATTLFGNPGQGNYVAANGWLEGFARMRRSTGLPATAVRWGAIDDVGFLARNHKIKESLQGRMGGNALHSDIALDVLEQVLLSGRSGIGVLELDWNSLRRFLPSADHARFDKLTRLYGNDSSADDCGDRMLHLAELSDDELQAAVSDILKQEVGQILRLQPDKISMDRSLYEMGLDSLMGVELVTALEARFGIQLPVMALSEGPTIGKLTNRVVAHIRGGEQPDGDSLRNQVAQMARMHDSDVPEAALDDISERVATATDRMIN